MSRVEGVVVVRRPDLGPRMLAPANSFDFVKTWRSYFAIFKSSLFPIRYSIAGVPANAMCRCIHSKQQNKVDPEQLAKCLAGSP